MKEFQYNISEDGIKELVKSRFHNDKEIKKNFLKRWIKVIIMIVILVFILTRILKYNFIISSIFILGSLLLMILIFPGAKWINCKVATNEYLIHIKPYINKEIFVKFDNEDIEVKKYGAICRYKLQNCNTLLIDKERIYIKFSDSSMIYIPLNIFETDNEMNEFIKLLK